MLSVQIQHVMLYRKRRAFVQWKVNGITPATSVLSFRVERSSNMFNDFEVIAEGVTDSYYNDPFLAGNPNVLSAVRSLVYRVVIEGQVEDVASVPVNIYGLQLVEVNKSQALGVVPTANQIDRRNQGIFFKNPKFNRRNILVWRAKARRAAVAQRLSGDPVVYLKQRHFGLRCPEEGCYDAVLRANYQGSTCSTCYGTTWAGGYHTPIQGYGIVQRSPINVQDTPRGKLSIGSAMIIAPPVPMLEKGDIIVELDSNIRWKVDNADSQHLFKRSVMQTTSCTLLARSDVEQLIPLGESRYTLEFQG